ncbi:hypothetical protein OHT61_24675 [Streptomyces sp. NBC_00178]|uniref:hypothetical protein n=1 Tax=Streptomyces sp. NBC_00178 TaxID=2975672 RepID=UPI002E291D4E|nr:hypothetical protein [Streptomyces sp. NBC_00178]
MSFVGVGDPVVLVMPLPVELPDTLLPLVERLTEMTEGCRADYTAAMGVEPEAADVRAGLAARLAAQAGEVGTATAERPAGSCVHDAFFSVRRGTGDSTAVLAGAILLSDLLVQEDLAVSGSTLDADPDSLLLGVTSYLTGTAAPVAKPGSWRTAHPVDAANQRWLVGHQRFFVMLQLLTLALRGLDTEGATPEQEQEAVRSFGRLCRSAAVSMRYAADFPPELYEEVRETMSPPAVNAGFSGLQTRDHHELVASMRRLKRDGGLDRLTPASRTAVHAAVQHLYEAHVWVCDRFGGAVEPSLLMAQAAHAAGERAESGVVAAQRLARQRLGHLTPSGSA